MLPRSRASLSTRFLLTLGGLLVFAILLLALINVYVINPIMLEKETADAQATQKRLIGAIEYSKRHLLAHTHDWAHWDATYAYVQGEQLDYAQTNASQDMLTSLNNQLILIFNEEGTVHWLAGINPHNGSYATCGDTQGECRWAAPIAATLMPLLTAVSNDTTTSQDKGTGKVLILNEPWPAMIGVSPILPTDHSGPGKGWLAVVRSIDDRFIEDVKQQTGLSFMVSAAPSQTAPTLQPISRSDDHLILRQQIANPLAQQPLEISARIPRDKFHANTRAVRYIVGWTASLLIVSMLVVLWLLERMILSPLRQLTRYTRHLHSGAAAPPVPPRLLSRKGEIGTLAQEFRSLLERQHQQAEQLKRLSLYDHLTGVANRRLFDQRLTEALSQYDSQDISVMMIDIDHFKLYNDHYGHSAGDNCLNTLARCMEQQLSQHGFLLARTGGEEFSALLPGVALDDAMAYAEALVTTVSDLALPHAPSPTSANVTISIGVAAYHAESTMRPDIMRAADMALYQAKGKGRNRAVAATRQAFPSQTSSNPAEP